MLLSDKSLEAKLEDQSGYAFKHVSGIVRLPPGEIYSHPHQQTTLRAGRNARSLGEREESFVSLLPTMGCVNLFNI